MSKTPGQLFKEELDRRSRARTEAIWRKTQEALEAQPELVALARTEGWFADLQSRLRELAMVEWDSKRHRYELVAITDEEVKMFRERAAARPLIQQGAFRGMRGTK